MVKSLNYSLEKILEDNSEKEKCKDELIDRLKHISEKVVVNDECLDELKLVKNKFFKQIDDHIQAEITRLGSIKKMEVKKELENFMNNFEKDILKANEDGNQVKSKLEEEMRNIFEVAAQNKYGSDYSKSPNYDDFDDDALMINESINEFSENVNDKRINLLRNIFSNIERLSNVETKFLNNDFYKKINSLDLAKCSVNLEEICLGHLKSSLVDLGLVDHTSFKLETSLLDNLSFEKGKECLIQFYCPFYKDINDEYDNFCKNLSTELIDSNERAVQIVLKEKISSNSTSRHFFLYFNPSVCGIHKLIIKYKNNYILKSPLHFVVLSQNKKETYTPTSMESNVEKFDFNVNDTNFRLKNLNLKQDASEPVNRNRSNLPSFSSLLDTSQRNSFEKNFSSVITVGRGRLLKSIKDSINAKERIQQNGIALGFMSQKRKSPSNQSDLNNNDIVNTSLEEDRAMKESSNKLKRADAMDTDQLHAFFTPATSNPNAKLNVCILSNHLKKYYKPQGSRLLKGEPLPPLKAQFMQKFVGFNFPIGVRVCVLRNWLIVCDCGNHAVKIFDRTESELLHTIKSDNDSLFTFVRPSALLIDYENNNELYVKDDKEILVFDLSQNLRFIRKFGFKILQRPYGLTFNRKGQLIVVDANIRNPLIHIFNKTTGELIKSSPYQPAMPQFSKSSTLNNLYYNNNADLPPFEKSKIRFIDCHQDYIYASDLGRSIVFKTTLEGKTELAFGTFGKKFGQLNEPSGIHVDYDGKAILVGDSKNNRIQIYDDEGNYKCDIDFIDEKIVRPSDIHIDIEGYLYVTCFIQHCIKKFKLI